MGLRIELEFLWKRLQTRFKARRKTDTDPEDPDHPILLETVQPITNFDDLAKELLIEEVGTITRASAGGAGLTSTLSVPLGERWTIYAIAIARTIGDGTLTGLQAVGAVSIEIDTQGAASAFNTHLLPLKLVLEEGQGILAYVNALTSDSTWSVRLIYEREDAF